MIMGFRETKREKKNNKNTVVTQDFFLMHREYLESKKEISIQEFTCLEIYSKSGNL